jgi:hypothetical protein
VVSGFENGHFVGPTIFDHVMPGISVGEMEIYGVAFYTESKCVTSRWFSEEDKKETRVSTWEGTITRK